MDLIFLAGTPPTKVNSSTSSTTTAPAATTAPLPMVTPGRIVARAPIHAKSQTVIGLLFVSSKGLEVLRLVTNSWVPVIRQARNPALQPFPNVIPLTQSRNP